MRKTFLENFDEKIILVLFLKFFILPIFFNNYNEKFERKWEELFVDEWTFLSSFLKLLQVERK